MLVSRLYELFVGGGAHSVCTSALANEFLDRYTTDPDPAPVSITQIRIETDPKPVRFTPSSLSQVQFG